MASTAKTATHVRYASVVLRLEQKTTSREKVLEKLNAAAFLQQGLKAYGPNSAASKAALESRFN